MTDPASHPNAHTNDRPDQPAAQQRGTDGDAAESHRPWRVAPARDGRGAAPPPAGMPPSLLHRVLVAIVVFMFINWAFALATSTRPAQHTRIPYSPLFLNEVAAGNIATVTSRGSALQGAFRRAVSHTPPGKTVAQSISRFQTEVPTFADTTSLLAQLRAKNVVVNAKPIETATPWWRTLLVGFVPTLLFIGLMVMLMRRAASHGGMGGLGGMTKSRAKRYEATATQRVTFADVAGIDEATDELSEVVDFLRQPERYRRLGGRIPRGVLLSGPPGTGKTLLARAVAGEADVPFFSISASEFIEMIVGVGAGRVRDLFTQAKAAAPAIVFIDELDAIGRSRGAALGGLGGGHDEREQTLNQILTEMDGFEATTGVIVLAATNRPDVLDAALLRPGRFDRRVAVQPPDTTGRRRILDVHTRSMPLAADVDLDRLAATSAGMVGADLANLANEAALLAARRDHQQVEMSDFSGALEKLVLGAERRIILTAEDRRRTAYHEAGHALVGMLTPGADPVRKVSIVPRGAALGVTYSAAAADRFNYTRTELLARIDVALGGRVAEELVYDEPTTGAEADIRQLTALARQMVARWGMSDLVGPIDLLPNDDRPTLAITPTDADLVIGQEVAKLVTSSHDRVTELLGNHRPQLDALVDALLAGETLEEPQIYAAVGLTRVHADAREDSGAAQPR